MRAAIFDLDDTLYEREQFVLSGFAAVDDELERKLPAFRAPLLVVRGGHDPLCPPSWAEEVARRAPRGRLAIIPDGAHAVHHSHPAELATLVRAFLEEPA